MQVTFPYTNPIVFTRPGQYHNWRDAYSFAQRGCFLQPFAAEDRITFQFSWRGVRRNRTHTIKVEVVTGDSRATFTQYAISGTASGGTAGKSCYSQTPTGILYADGYAFGWITVEMARRRNAQSYSDGGTDTYTYTEEEQAYKEVWFEIPPGQPLAVKTESASVLIESFGRDWYLDDGGAGVMKEVAPNKVSGSGNQRVEFTAGRNASKDAKERLLYVRETGTDRLLMTIRLCQRARRQGISFGAVGDTLFVYEESLVN